MTIASAPRFATARAATALAMRGPVAVAPAAQA